MAGNVAENGLAKGMLRDENYDLDSITQLIVGGDGAKWVRQSFDLLGLPSEFVLDRYHLYTNARQAYGFTAQTSNWIHQITQEGIEAALPEMLHALPKDPPVKAKRMHQFVQYLVKNRDGLLDPDYRAHLQPSIHRLGAIEGNVDKLVVRRLKGRGRSWSLDGAKAMLAVCRHKAKLKQGAFKPFEKSPKKSIGKTRKQRMIRVNVCKLASHRPILRTKICHGEEYCEIEYIRQEFSDLCKYAIP